MQVLTFGQQGEEVNLELILRVVADVGLIVSVYFLFSFSFAHAGKYYPNVYYFFFFARHQMCTISNWSCKESSFSFILNCSIAFCGGGILPSLKLPSFDLDGL